jgi:hypothetical protein
MWSARPTDIADERRRTNHIDLDERRPIIVQRRNSPAAIPIWLEGPPVLVSTPVSHWPVMP